MKRTTRKDALEQEIEIARAWANAEPGCVVPADGLNVDYAFQPTAAALLVLIARGEIDMQKLAVRELRSRGLDANGNWAPRIKG